MSYEDFPRYGYSKFSLEVWFLKPRPNFFEFQSSRNLMSFDRDEYRKSRDELRFIWSHVVPELFFSLVFSAKSPWSSLDSYLPRNFLKFLWNFHISKLYYLWERNLSLSCWFNLHGCLVHVSRNAVFQNWSENFPWIPHGTKKWENSRLCGLVKFNVIQHRWTWIDSW